MTKKFRPTEDVLLDMGMSNTEIVKRIYNAQTIEDLSVMRITLMEENIFEVFSFPWHEQYEKVLAESARITSKLLYDIRTVETRRVLKVQVFADIVMAANLNHINSMDKQTLINAYHHRKAQLAVQELNMQSETVTA